MWLATATSIFGCTRLTHGTHVSPHLGVCSSSSSSKQINNKELALPSCARYSAPIIMLTESGTHAMLRAGEHTVDEDWVYGTEMEIHAVQVPPYALYLRRVLHVRPLNNIGALRSRSACIRRFNIVCLDGRVWNVGRETMESTKKGRKIGCDVFFYSSFLDFIIYFPFHLMYAVLCGLKVKSKIQWVTEWCGTFEVHRDRETCRARRKRVSRTCCVTFALMVSERTYANTGLFNCFIFDQYFSKIATALKVAPISWGEQIITSYLVLLVFVGFDGITVSWRRISSNGRTNAYR